MPCIPTHKTLFAMSVQEDCDCTEVTQWVDGLETGDLDTHHPGDRNAEFERRVAVQFLKFVTERATRQVDSRVPKCKLIVDD